MSAGLSFDASMPPVEKERCLTLSLESGVVTVSLLKSYSHRQPATILCFGTREKAMGKSFDGYSGSGCGVFAI
jgi:hypothetical protein